MKTGYSFSQGVSKSLISLLSIAGAILVFTHYSDIGIWDLLETYLKPLIGSLTIGGAITLAVNWVKYHTTA